MKMQQMAKATRVKLKIALELQANPHLTKVSPRCAMQDTLMA